MSAGQHTPGPWSVKPEEVDRAYIRIRGTRLGGRFKIANVLTPTYEGSPPREAEETRANARLIAAAPELLEFAQEVRRSGDTRLASMALAVIAKATGQQGGAA